MPCILINLYLNTPTPFPLLPRQLICFAFLFFISVKTYEQPGGFTKIPPQFEVEKIPISSNKDFGLFADIREDQAGYLWMTGNKGLHVFDGDHIITYNSSNLPYRMQIDSGSNEYKTLAAGEKNIYQFVEGSRRIICWDPVQRIVTRVYADKQSKEDLFIVAGSYDGPELYFLKYFHASKTIALCLKKGNDPERKIFEIPVILNNRILYKIINGEHWLVYGDSIYRISLDGKVVTPIVLPGSENGCFNFDSIGSDVYFLSFNQESVYKMNPGSGQAELFIRIPEIFNGRLQVFFLDKGLLYLGSNLNLAIFDLKNKTYQDLSGQFTELVKQSSGNSLSEGLGKMIRLKSGQILLMSESSIYRIKKKQLPADRFLETLVQGPSAKPVLSYRGITEDDRHTIYASYYTGLARKAAGEKVFRAMPVQAYMKGPLVSVYGLTTWRHLLFWNNVKINLQNGQSAYLFDSVFSGHCTLYQEHDSLWMFKWGTKTMYCYDLLREKLSSMPINIVTQSNNNIAGVVDINDMVPDASGSHLWLSSHDFGICLFSKKGVVVKEYRAQELGLTDNYVTDLEMVGAQLWFGCTEGLGKLDTRTGEVHIYRNPAVRNGEVKNRTVFSIQKDTGGNFYLGSSYGLVYFDTHTQFFYNLPEGHPLSAIEFNRASGFHAADGRYYFGSTDGLYSFTAKELEFALASTAIKPLKLYGVSCFNSRTNEFRYYSEKLDSLKELVFSPADNNIEFHFSVPFHDGDIYFSYRLKGLNDKWSEYKPDNTFQLNSLPPGNYVLEVKASAGLSDMNASYYSLPLKMKQVWYKRAGFITLVVIVAVGLLFLFLRSRFNRRVQQQKGLAELRTKISSDLHDDVGTILSGLAMQSQMLAYSAPAEQKESLNEISNMSRDAMERMRDTVWAMDSRKDKYENLIDRMRAFGEKNLAAANMTHDFIISDIDTKRFINPEKRQTIYLIFKEAITNIVKHSDGHHVSIRLAHEGKGLHLTVHDNGTQKPESVSDGLGMSNMKMRAGNIGGTVIFSYDHGFRMELFV